MRRRSAASNGTTLVRPLPEWGQIIQREPRATASPTDNAFIRASEHYGPTSGRTQGRLSLVSSHVWLRTSDQSRIARAT